MPTRVKPSGYPLPHPLIQVTLISLLSTTKGPPASSRHIPCPICPENRAQAPSCWEIHRFGHDTQSWSVCSIGWISNLWHFPGVESGMHKIKRFIERIRLRSDSLTFVLPHPDASARTPSAMNPVCNAKIKTENDFSYHFISFAKHQTHFTEHLLPPAIDIVTRRACLQT